MDFDGRDYWNNITRAASFSDPLSLSGHEREAKRKLVIIDVSFSFLLFSFFAGNDTAWIHPDERRD